MHYILKSILAITILVRLAEAEPIKVLTASAEAEQNIHDITAHLPPDENDVSRIGARWVPLFNNDGNFLGMKVFGVTKKGLCQSIPFNTGDVAIAIDRQEVKESGDFPNLSVLCSNSRTVTVKRGEEIVKLNRKSE
jgi:hypothetical protein